MPLICLTENVLTDTPCNEMHTDQFIEEIKGVGQNLGLPSPLIIQVTFNHKAIYIETRRPTFVVKRVLIYHSV